ncbi:MAG: tRNA (guanosine(37)-N1)-methyltransferase TrmD [Methyloligellaceae bacterium]
MNTPWKAHILTLFPDMYPGPLGVSVVGQALQSGIWSLDCTDIREFGTGKHKSVDDTPSGGGPGMVMRADVIGDAVDSALAQNSDVPLIYLSPRGKPFNQKKAHELASEKGVVLLCGRFEGVDQRVLDARNIEEVSIGDYVLSGGEIASMALLDAVVRLLPGVLGAKDSISEESFEQGLLEYPQYTRPRKWENRNIPEMLQSGNHARIAEWRREQAIELTKVRRPDLWERYLAEKVDKNEQE